MSLWSRSKQLNQKLFPQFESLKQGRLAKAVSLVTDYKQAFKDIFNIIRTKPLRSAVQGTVCGGGVWCAKQCPKMDDYVGELLSASNKHSLIADTIRSKRSFREVKKLMWYYSQDRLRHVDLVVCSLLFVQEHSQQYDHVDKHCKVLAPPWYSFNTWSNTLVDVGFAGKWLFLEKLMLDYDINEDEFPDDGS